jgi:hypothetical protein
MCRKLLAVVGLIVFAGGLQSDDKGPPPVKVAGKVTAVDKEKGQVTFVFKAKTKGKEDEEHKKTLTVDEFLLTDPRGKKYEGKDILTVLELGDPIIIPRNEKEKDKIVVVMTKKK